MVIGSGLSGNCAHLLVSSPDVTFSRGKEAKGRPWGSTSAAIQAVQVTSARFLQAQALLGLGQKSKARALLTDVLRRDPNHALASDL